MLMKAGKVVFSALLTTWFVLTILDLLVALGTTKTSLLLKKQFFLTVKGFFRKALQL